MKRKILIAAAAVAALLVVIVAVLPLLVDVDDYRPRVEEALARATGRGVELGELSFSLLPAPSLRAAGVTIGEDPAFGEEPFLRSGALSVRVSPFPLLRGALEIGAVTILSPDLRVTRSAEGWNLSSLMAAPREEAAPGGRDTEAAGVEGPGAVPRSGPAGETGEGTALTIRELNLRGGSITFRDDALHPGRPVQVKARDIDLELTEISPASPMGVRLAMSVEGSGGLELDGTVGPAREGGPGLPVNLHVVARRLQASQLAPYLEAFTGVSLHGGEVGADLTVGGSPPAAMEVKGTVDLAEMSISPLLGEGPPATLDASLRLEGGRKNEVTRLDRGELVVNGTVLSVTGSLSESGGAGHLTARIRAADAGVAGILPVLALLGPLVPEAVGPAGTISVDAALEGRLDRLEDLALSGSASFSGLEIRSTALREPVTDISGSLTLEENQASVEGLGLSLGRSRLEGGCRIRDFDAPVVEVDLNAPMLDVDELLAILSPAGSGTVALSTAPGARPALQVAGIAAPASPAQGGGIPSAPPAPGGGAALPDLEHLTVRGKLAAAQARLLNLELSAFQARVELAAGQARIAETSMSLYGGTFTGDITAELSKSGPPFTVNASLEGVDFNSMAADFSPELDGLLHGTLDAGLQLSGSGLARDQLREMLRGDATFSLVDGRLTTVGVLKDLASALEAAGGRGIGQEETPFSYLGGTFRLKGGRVRTEDLTLESPDIALNGEGTMTMELGLDLELTGLISPEVSAAMVAQRKNLRFMEDKKERIRLDLAVGGTLMEPAVRVDPEMIRRVLKNAARERLGGKLRDLLKGKDDD